MSTNIFGKLAEYTLKACEAVIVAILVFLIVVVMTNVILRYAFSSGIVQIEEIARFLFSATVFFGAIVVAIRTGHLSAPIVIPFLRPLHQVVVLTVGDLISIGLCLFMIDGFWRQTLITMNSLTPILRLPTSLLYGMGLAMTIGIGLAIAGRGVHRIVHYRRTGQADASAAETTID